MAVLSTLFRCRCWGDAKLDQAELGFYKVCMIKGED